MNQTTKRKFYHIPEIFKARLKAEAEALNIGMNKLVYNLVVKAGIVPERYNAHLNKSMIQAYDLVLSRHYGIAYKRKDEPNRLLTCSDCGQFFKPSYSQKSRERRGNRVYCKDCWKRSLKNGNENR